MRTRTLNDQCTTTGSPIVASRSTTPPPPPSWQRPPTPKASSTTHAPKKPSPNSPEPDPRHRQRRRPKASSGCRRCYTSSPSYAERSSLKPAKRLSSKVAGNTGVFPCCAGGHGSRGQEILDSCGRPEPHGESLASGGAPADPDRPGPDGHADAPLRQREAQQAEALRAAEDEAHGDLLQTAVARGQRRLPSEAVRGRRDKRTFLFGGSPGAIKANPPNWEGVGVLGPR